jgi:Permuted papain-like amidase enzyme, YaeF/YiiX, C92 family
MTWLLDWMLDRVGRWIAAYLQRPASGYEPFTPADPAALRACIKPGDILLIEGRNHISGIVKYLTQSTWSHAALYVGPISGRITAGGEPCELVESNMDAGIIAVPLSTYLRFHTRICRPVGLSPADCQVVCDYAIERIGLQYDLRNFIDLARYMVPLPVPQRWRRRMIALGSGDPTKLICSALIAQAFGAIGYPILPAIERVESENARREIYHIRHSSLYTPRDFDISPYFSVVKPTIEMGFDYKSIHWFADDRPTGR